jgi:hypothetical protein
MGRVNEWTDAGDGADQCAAKLDEELDTLTWEGGYNNNLPYLQPAYFDWDAPNVATPPAVASVRAEKE